MPGWSVPQLTHSNTDPHHEYGSDYEGNIVALLREDKTQKRDYTLMPLEYEERIIDRFQMGADKYARDDWRKATWNDRQTYYASIHRHLRQAQDGDKSEDHLAALIVDAIILMHAESEPERVVSQYGTSFCAACTTIYLTDIGHTCGQES
jgi:hypothetical protein